MSEYWLSAAAGTHAWDEACRFVPSSPARRSHRGPKGTKGHQRTRATTVHATLMQASTSGRRLGRSQDADGLIKRLHLDFCSGDFGQRWVLRRKTAGFYHVSRAGVASPHPHLEEAPEEASFAGRRRRNTQSSQSLGSNTDD